MVNMNPKSGNVVKNVRQRRTIRGGGRDLATTASTVNSLKALSPVLFRQWSQMHVFPACEKVMVNINRKCANVMKNKRQWA